MNEVHLHLLVNHFPIIGLFFGFFILLFGIIKNNSTLKSTAYIIFIFCTIMGKISMMTGSKAEPMTEKITEIIHEDIHVHADKASLFMKPLYILGLVSVFGLVSIVKKRENDKFVSICVFLIAAICIFLSKDVGTSGGEIRHTEIKQQANNNGTLEQNNLFENETNSQ